MHHKFRHQYTNNVEFSEVERQTFKVGPGRSIEKDKIGKVRPWISSVETEFKNKNYKDIVSY